MAYPGHHSGMGSVYPSYHHQIPPYQSRQNPLPPPQPHQLQIPQTVSHQAPPQPQYQHPQYTMPPATSASTEPPQTPGHDSDAEEELNRNRPEIEPISKEHNNRAYVLKVIQQPERARMCGFGDKDRRPISPPPCIKLCIYDTSVNPPREIDYSKVDDLSRYVIMVDLACMETLLERNLVTHPASSPSISTTTTSAFPPTQTNASLPGGSIQNFSVSSIPEYYDRRFAQPSGAASRHQPSYWGNEYAHPNTQYPYHGQTQYTGVYTQPNGAYASDQQRASINGGRSSANGTLSRNLIGSLSGSAFKLKDMDRNEGLWFVFQDLSVRTEGWFRLKFTFFDLKDSLNPEATTAAHLSKFAPMLACVYSRPFKVYSAKRFPGVIESTHLSKKFAEQGIKIPIRKDIGREQRSGDKRKRERASDGEGADSADDDAED